MHKLKNIAVHRESRQIELQKMPAYMGTSQKQIINNPSCSCHKGLNGTHNRSKSRDKR